MIAVVPGLLGPHLQCIRSAKVYHDVGTDSQFFLALLPWRRQQAVLVTAFSADPHNMAWRLIGELQAPPSPATLAGIKDPA